MSAAMAMAGESAVATGDGRKERLLPSRRMSDTYDSHLQASTQGETSVRMLAFAGGMGLVACSLIVWTHWIARRRFSWLEMAVSTTSLAVGVCALVLESNLSFLETARVNVTTRARVLGQVRGRGSMYAAAGMLQCAMFDPLDLVVGLYTAAVGVYMIRVGQKASASLSTLKESITDEKALLEAFQANDRNGDGVLEVFEFDGLIYSLGIELDNDELEAAFSSIDTNGDKKIVYDEFRTWWKACTAEADIPVCA
mmetsp:Transcript_3728/g.7834  ORF Transcript_3728/g.7834 Transcript_3728/m.7834 type:complete len:254 (-) Transcript_3728:291-1052(-)